MTRAKRILACLPLSLFNFTTHFWEVSSLDKFPSLIAVSKKRFRAHGHTSTSENESGPYCQNGKLMSVDASQTWRACDRKGRAGRIK